MGQHSFIPLHFLIVVLIHMMKLLRIYMKLWIQIEEKGFSHAVIFFFFNILFCFIVLLAKKWHCQNQNSCEDVSTAFSLKKILRTLMNPGFNFWSTQKSFHTLIENQRFINYGTIPFLLFWYNRYIKISKKKKSQDKNISFSALIESCL